MEATLADLYEARYGEATELGRDRPAEGELARQLDHRSHRRWADRPVTDAELDLLLAAALSVPTKSDLMQIAVLHVADQAKLNRVAELIPEMPWIADAPAFLVFCGDGRRIRRICELRGTAFAHNPLDAFFNAAVDAALAMSAFIRAAEAEGLVTCPISAVREPVEEIAELLGLPEAVFPVAGLCVGYPTWEPWISLRLPPRVMVHRDRYDDSNFEAEMDGYDRRRAERNPIKRQRDVDAYGEKAFYGWSDDKARQGAHRERAGFADFVRRSYRF
jgi:nitroreductase/FMN reductase [NAD(P)H]